MRIESVSGSPDRAGRYRVVLSDQRVLRLYRQTLEDFGLYPGLELTDRQLEKLLEAAGAMSAKMRAVRIVSAANVSKGDLEQRLQRKGETAQDAKNAVEWMEELHLLDDRNTAEQVVHSCIRKGYGRSRARQVLYDSHIILATHSGILTSVQSTAALAATSPRTERSPTTVFRQS